MILARGEVREGKAFANNVALGIEQIGQRAEEAVGFASRRTFQEVIGALLTGIEAITRTDAATAKPLLEQVTGSTSPVMRWVTLWWRSRAFAMVGQQEQGEDLGADAMEVARELGETFVGATHCLFAELEALEGVVEPALDRLQRQIPLLEQLGDKYVLSLVWMARARILTGAGMEQESIAAADQARVIDPRWADPWIFLSRRAVKQGDLEGAARTLEAVQPPFPGAVVRELKILRQAADGEIPLWVLAEFQDLRDQVPSEETAAQLQVLTSYSPCFTYGREVLGWKLLYLGQVAAAERCFSALLEEDLDPDLRASVRMGHQYASMERHRTCPTTELAPVQPKDETPAPGVDLESSKPQGAFVGSLELFAVPDLLEFLRASRRTGLLVLKKDNKTGSVCLEHGALTAASSPSYSHVGGRLLQMGVITGEQQLEPDTIGWANAPDVELPADVLRRALDSQIRSALGELIAWDRGNFCFHTGAYCGSIPAEVKLTVDTQEAVLDALRALDEKNCNSGMAPPD